MKRKIILFIAILLTTAVTGCGNDPNPSETPTPSAQSQTPTPTTGEGEEDEDAPWGIPPTPSIVAVAESPYTTGFISPEDTLLKDMKEIGFENAEEFERMFPEILRTKNWSALTDYVSRASVLSYLYTENKAETAEELMDALAHAFGNPITNPDLTGDESEKLDFSLVNAVEYDRYVTFDYARSDTDDEERDKFNAFLHAINGRYYYEINPFNSQVSTGRFALYQPLGFDNVIQKLGDQSDAVMPLYGYIFDEGNMEIQVIARHSKNAVAVEITTDKETLKTDLEAPIDAGGLSFFAIPTDEAIGEIEDISYYTPDGEKISYRIIR